MKLFFDCLLTAPSPKQCSTTMQFMKLFELLVGVRDDIYFYWAIPNDLSKEARAEYLEHDRIKYVEIEQKWKDRNVEYRRLPAEYSRILRNDGECWDWDVMVTVRTPLIPNMRAIASSYRIPKSSRKKKIILIEDMMVCTKKPTVAIGDMEAQDIMLVTGYLGADVVLCPAYHQKQWALEIAKEHLSFSHVNAIRKKFREVSHLCLEDYKQRGLKTKHRFKGGRKMNVAMVGRLERFGMRLDDINEILANSFIMGSDKIHPFICTITAGEAFVDTCAIEVRHPKQKEFWKICREEMDLTLAFSIDVELNMSKLEPTLFGVPTIAIRAPWSEAMFGVDYPFLVKTKNEAYGWIKAFADDYEKCYGMFAEWYNSWFIPTYKSREEEDGMYNILVEECLNYQDQLIKHVSDTFEDNKFVADVAAEMPIGEVFDMDDVLSAMVKAKKLEGAQIAKYRNGVDGFNLAFTQDWHLVRVGLQLYHNVKDAGKDLGIFIKTA